MSSNNVESWTCGNVSTWLENNGFTETVIDSFRRNEIDGSALLLLDADLVKELIPTIKHRLEFHALVKGTFDIDVCLSIRIFGPVECQLS